MQQHLRDYLASRYFPLKKLLFPALAALGLFLSTGQLALWSQTSIAPMEDRRKALNELFHEYWDANLENSPEFASMIGDSRFNDKISDVSVKAFNNWLATEQTFLMRLAAIDPTGLTDQEKTSRDLLLRDLAQDQ
jgi:uncharacterized protein (DUF885 family)